mmetsp:Transcript_3229/g.6473  ORF Transcript_3229/g.6473 Transcript_3229/m.6473 type:complete len:209 (-) Transcript_3229:714-1340(-)
MLRKCSAISDSSLSSQHTLTSVVFPEVRRSSLCSELPCGNSHISSSWMSLQTTLIVNPSVPCLRLSRSSVEVLSLFLTPKSFWTPYAVRHGLSEEESWRSLVSLPLHSPLPSSSGRGRKRPLMPLETPLRSRDQRRNCLVRRRSRRLEPTRHVKPEEKLSLRTKRMTGKPLVQLNKMFHIYMHHIGTIFHDSCTFQFFQGSKRQDKDD